MYTEEDTLSLVGQCLEVSSNEYSPEYLDIWNQYEVKESEESVVDFKIIVERLNEKNRRQLEEIGAPFSMEIDRKEISTVWGCGACFSNDSKQECTLL